ncbi:hypothetical protein RJ640_016663, partial [Escallonia rubra]
CISFNCDSHYRTGVDQTILRYAGPGCSSLIGAWMELGPFRVNSDGKTLFRNDYAWNNGEMQLTARKIGNAWIDDATNAKGKIDYWWTHALISDETHEELIAECHFVNNTSSANCGSVISDSLYELGNIDHYNIYICAYLSTPQAQKWLHRHCANGFPCKIYKMDQMQALQLYSTGFLDFHLKSKIIEKVTKTCICCFYSGDIDSVVPITSTKYSLNWLKLPIEKPWYPWNLNDEVSN